MSSARCIRPQLVQTSAKVETSEVATDIMDKMSLVPAPKCLIVKPTVIGVDTAVPKKKNKKQNDKLNKNDKKKPKTKQTNKKRSDRSEEEGRNSCDVDIKYETSFMCDARSGFHLRLENGIR